MSATHPGDLGLDFGKLHQPVEAATGLALRLSDLILPRVDPRFVRWPKHDLLYGEPDASVRDRGGRVPPDRNSPETAITSGGRRAGSFAGIVRTSQTAPSQTASIRPRDRAGA